MPVVAQQGQCIPPLTETVRMQCLFQRGAYQILSFEICALNIFVTFVRLLGRRGAKPVDKRKRPFGSPGCIKGSSLQSALCYC